MVDLSQALTHGLGISLFIGVLIIVSLRVNPRIWLQDYPETVRKLAPPLNSQEKRLRLLFAIPFLAGMFVLPYLSTRAFVTANSGDGGFTSAYVYALIILQVFNLFDAVVIDALFLGVIKPRFAFIPEAWNNPETFAITPQVVNFAKGVVIVSIFSLIIAFAAITF